MPAWFSRVPGYRLAAKQGTHLLSSGPESDVAATPAQLPPCLNAPLLGLVTPNTLVRVLKVVTMPACSTPSHLRDQWLRVTSPGVISYPEQQDRTLLSYQPDMVTNRILSSEGHGDRL